MKLQHTISMRFTDSIQFVCLAAFITAPHVMCVVMPSVRCLTFLDSSLMCRFPRSIGCYPTLPFSSVSTISNLSVCLCLCRIQIKPDNAVALANLAAAYKDSGQLLEAIKHYQVRSVCCLRICYFTGCHSLLVRTLTCERHEMRREVKMTSIAFISYPNTLLCPRCSNINSLFSLPSSVTR